MKKSRRNTRTRSVLAASTRRPSRSVLLALYSTATYGTGFVLFRGCFVQRPKINTLCASFRPTESQTKDAKRPSSYHTILPSPPHPPPQATKSGVIRNKQRSPAKSSEFPHPKSEQSHSRNRQSSSPRSHNLPPQVSPRQHRTRLASSPSAPAPNNPHAPAFATIVYRWQKS